MRLGICPVGEGRALAAEQTNYKKRSSRFGCLPELSRKSKRAAAGLPLRRKREQGSRTPHEFAYLSEVADFTFRPGATTGCKKGIMARRPGPSCSIECCCSALRLARKLGQPLSFSAI